MSNDQLQTSTFNDQSPVAKAFEKKYDIHERIFDFVIQVINLTKNLSKTQQNLVLIGQITRSVTSIGANDQEGDGAGTRKDFTHCYTIVKK